MVKVERKEKKNLKGNFFQINLLFFLSHLGFYFIIKTKLIIIINFTIKWSTIEIFLTNKFSVSPSNVKFIENLKMTHLPKITLPIINHIFREESKQKIKHLLKKIIKVIENLQEMKLQENTWAKRCMMKILQKSRKL